MTDIIDLSRLPAPKIIEELSFEQIRDDMISGLPKEYRLVPSDVGYKVIEVAAMREVLLRSRINESIKETLLPFASGENLQNLVALFNTEAQINADGEIEDDESLRQRALEAFDGKTTAGAEASYEFHVNKIAKGKVIDVNVYSPEEGVVEVVLLPSDEIASDDDKKALVDEVRRGLNDLRPITDNLKVRLAVVVGYSVKAAVKIIPGVDKTTVEEDARISMLSYLEERRKIGAGVPRSGVLSAAHRTSEGAYNPNVESASVSIFIGGREVKALIVGSDDTAKVEVFELRSEVV